MAANALPNHPIFDDILRGDLGEVQRRVLADPAVLEEREGGYQQTPFIYSIFHCKPAIALWLIQHRGQHDVDSRDRHGGTALHWACSEGPLSVVQALVGAGANPAALDNNGETPLMFAADNDHPDIVAFLLQLPAAKAAIDAISSGDYPNTALSLASRWGYLSVVQLLLDHGADPTIPAGPNSPLILAILYHHHDIAALLRRAINDAGITRFLHKARSLLDAAATIAKARKDAHDKGLSPAEQQHKALAAAPEWLKG
jgi:ankyrin repeat protein